MENNEHLARDLLARSATEQLKQLISTYSAGIHGYQPTDDSIDTFNKVSHGLLYLVATYPLKPIDSVSPGPAVGSTLLSKE